MLGFWFDNNCNVHGIAVPWVEMNLFEDYRYMIIIPLAAAIPPWELQIFIWSSERDIFVSLPHFILYRVPKE